MVDIKHRFPIIFLICGTVFMGVLGGAMAIPVLPAIAQIYGLTPSEASWMFIAIELFMVIGSVLYAKLANIYQIRNLFLFGILCFSAGSILAGISDNYYVLVVARMSQGLGASAYPPLAMIMITQYFDEQSRGKIMALIGPIIGIASQIGPLVGGFIAQQFGWKTVFSITAIILLFAPLCFLIPKDQRMTKEPFDFLGAFLFFTGIVCFVLGLNLNFYFLLVSLVFLVLFWRHSRSSEKPFIDVSLLRNTRFLLLSLGGALTIFTLNGTMLITPIFLANINQLSPGMIGLVLFPGAVISLIAAVLIGKLTTKYGYDRVATVSIGILITGYLLLTGVIGASPMIIAICLILVYIGFTNAQGMFPNLITDTLPAKQLNTGLGIYNLIFFFGATAGPTFMGTFLENNIVLPWNVGKDASSFVYSNGFLTLALITSLTFVILIMNKRMQKRDYLHVS